MRAADQRLRVAGLRDYAGWAHDLFPGRIGPTDLDCVVHREDGNLVPASRLAELEAQFAAPDNEGG